MKKSEVYRTERSISFCVHIIASLLAGYSIKESTIRNRLPKRLAQQLYQFKFEGNKCLFCGRKYIRSDKLRLHLLNNHIMILKDICSEKTDFLFKSAQ